MNKQSVFAGYYLAISIVGLVLNHVDSFAVS